jgi:choline-sulfatase
LLDNTVVIFCSDHGDMIDERGLWYKMSFYDGSARVPSIMAGPGIPAGHRVRSNCAHVDLLPTLVELAAGKEWNGYPEPVDGKSLLPLLTAEEPERIAVSELFSEGVAAPYVMLRKGKYKINFVEHDPPQVFDMEADPDELHGFGPITSRLGPNSRSRCLSTCMTPGCGTLRPSGISPGRWIPRSTASSPARPPIAWCWA